MQVLGVLATAITLVSLCLMTAGDIITFRALCDAPQFTTICMPQAQSMQPLSSYQGVADVPLTGGNPVVALKWPHCHGLTGTRVPSLTPAADQQWYRYDRYELLPSTPREGQDTL